MGSATKALVGELFPLSPVSHKASGGFLSSGLLSCWSELSSGKKYMHQKAPRKPGFDERIAYGRWPEEILDSPFLMAESPVQSLHQSGTH